MKTHLAVLAACLAGQSVTVAGAQPAKLPIATGIWVKADLPCAAATNLFVYSGTRFGSVYFYGPDAKMGPANETEALTRTARTSSGFTMINDGPLEVATRGNGAAVIRAVSPAQGVQWSENVRLCPVASLPAKTRAALTRLRLLPPG